MSPVGLMVLALAVQAGGPAPQARVDGVIRDAETGAPLVGVRVALSDLGREVITDEEGRYRDLGEALDLNEASVGTLLARARRRFRASYGGTTHDG